MTTLLIKNATLMTFDEKGRVLRDHGLALKDQYISRLAPSESFDQSQFDEVIDARGRVVTPGLINAHTHFYSTFATGLNKALPANDFVGVLQNLWWRLDRKLNLEDVRYSALLACMDAIRHGTTTLIDHHASPGAVSGSLTAIAKAVEQTGLRACLCYEISDRDGQNVAQQGLDENVSFLKALQAGHHPSLRGLMGLHASFTLSEESLTQAIDHAQRLNAGIHIHLAEDQADGAHCRAHFGKSPVQRLAEKGGLGPKSICAHGIDTDDNDHKLLARSGTILTHQAQSNMNNAVGVLDVPRLLGAGILVGLGTDAMTANMLEELRSALWIRKLTDRTPSGGFMEVVDCLVRANPIIAKRLWGQVIGVLEEGAVADAVLFDYLPHTPLADDNALGHLVFGLSQSRVDTTIAQGRVLMQQGRMTCLDEDGLRLEARRLATALWQRF